MSAESAFGVENSIADYAQQVMLSLQGYGGEILFIPSCLVAFLAGWVVMRTCCSCTSKSDRTATPESNAKQVTRGRRLRSRPPDIDELKLVLVLRKDLKLSASDAADVCSTAAISAVELCESSADDGSNNKTALWSSYVRWWKEDAVAKVVVRCDSLQNLLDVETNARRVGLPCVVIKESVAAVGPAPVDDINEVCGSLKLY